MAIKASGTEFGDGIVWNYGSSGVLAIFGILINIVIAVESGGRSAWRI